MSVLMEKMKAGLFAFIPAKVSNRIVLRVMNLLRKWQRFLKKDYSFHLMKNDEAFGNHIGRLERDGGFVEDQNNYVDMWFGSCTMQYSGCEIFASYNALIHMGKEHAMNLSQLIAEFEHDGMMLSGKFGTAPGAIHDFFTGHGYKTTFTHEESEFDALGEKADSLILTMYNDRCNICKEVHTVHISKEDGMYTAHNVYCNGMVVGPYASVTELIEHINEGKAKGISLLGINK